MIKEFSGAVYRWQSIRVTRHITSLKLPSSGFHGDANKSSAPPGFMNH